MMSKFAKYLRDGHGVAAIEVAFIMPFLLLLYFGLVDLTELISFNRKANYSASVITDLVTQNVTTVSSSDIADYFKAAELIMKPVPATSVRFQVYRFPVAGSAVLLKESATGPSCGNAPSTASISTLKTDSNDVILGRVCLTYAPYIATFLGKNILGATSFTISEEIALRPRQSKTLTCTGCP